MAEWIKYEQSLNSHHKILAMSTWLSKQPRFVAWIMDGAEPSQDVTRDTTGGASGGATRSAYTLSPRKATVAVVVSAVLEFWCRSNGRGRVDGEDLILSDACVTDCDDMGDVPLFGEALSRVGFVVEEETEDGGTQLRLPNFLEHNTPKSEKSRQLHNKRQAIWRAKKRLREAERLAASDGLVVSNDGNVAPHVAPPEAHPVGASRASRGAIEKRREEKSREHTSKDISADAVAVPKEASKPKKKTLKDPAPPLEPCPLWDAIVEVTGSDASIKSVASHVGKVKKALLAADPPYTAEDVRKLAAIAPRELPWTKDRHLTLGEVEKNTSLVRAKNISLFSDTTPTKSDRESIEQNVAKQRQHLESLGK